jgi:glucosyl-3-phosphoglycerate synthase
MNGSARAPIPASNLLDWPVSRVLDLKGPRRISVVLPALNEESTVSSIVARIRALAMDAGHPLVDEIVVIDSGSTDGTAAVAAAAGARVVTREDALPSVPVLAGKGEAMWRSLFATTGDIVVFIDADLVDFDPRTVPALIGPLLADDGISLVKGYYDRPLRDDAGTVTSVDGGGRVTELVARPLLNLHWPELATLIQPLVGEYAARRSLLEAIPFACGYGVELAMLIDTLRLHGPAAFAQVDLGERRHEHQELRALGRMSAELWQVAIDRLDRDGRIVLVQEPQTTMVQFARSVQGHGALPRLHDVALNQRPPAISLEDYGAGTRGGGPLPGITAARRG